MSEADPYSPPPPDVRAPRRWAPSLIWLVPIVAALIGVALAVRAVLSAGVLIEIQFNSAEGLESGKTQVKYKDVVVGMVRGISLSDDLQSVNVLVELDRKAGQLAAADTRFWIVRPRIDTAGVSGLDTLVSGVYISLDVGTSTDSKRRFVGLDTPPAVTRDRKGTSFVLHADSLGSLGIGSPVYFRRIAVGRVGGFEMNPDGSGVTMQLFVYAPYDRFVTRNTRFWNASGIDIAIGAAGLQVNTESLASVLAGGVAFATPDEGAEPARPGYEFWLHGDRVAALAPPSGPPLRVRLRFVESLRGLAVGAPVDFRGVEFGKVEAIDLEYDPRRRHFVGNVLATVYPWRLGSAYQALRAAPGNGARRDAEILQRLVQDGLRAQLRSGNLLTGQLYVALDLMPKARKPAVEAFDTSGVVVIPTEPGSLAQLQTQIADIVEQLSQVPFAELGRDVRTAIGSADALLRRLEGELAPEAARTLAEAQRALEAANRGLLASDAGLQQDLRQTLQELERASRSFRVLADYLQRHPEALIRGRTDADEPTAQEDGP
ncbi:MlaD family protein [Fontimonas sp. SYSU GA230001]|uniref:PqiB family protein n=1 Tax=Fontimonas sp. SYSU GA230001 TaxID=3142450 RepID=UPI0032B57D43